MEVFDTVGGFAKALDAVRADGALVGIVPTMGALHDGHRALIARAVAECDSVAVTIFVNPLQFGDPDDLANYPRTMEADLAACSAEGAAFVFAPSVSEMYPTGPGALSTTVSVTGLTEGFEGASRPGHFDGVATVVAKLFAIAGRCRAYFGEKDFQQLAVVRRLVADLSLPVCVVGCPTVREADGLARSSRNVRLSPDERAAASVVPRALAAGAAAVGRGEDRPAALAEAMAAVVDAEPEVHLEYAQAVHADDLSVPAVLDPARPPRLLVAVRVGAVRLIDNCDPRAGGPAE